MLDHARSILLSLAVGAVLVAADPPAAAAPAPTPAAATTPAAASADKPAPKTLVGSIQSKKGSTIKVVMDPKDQKDAKDKEPQPFEIGDKTKVTIDGKDATLKKLQPEMKVTITYDATGVISVDATEAKKSKKKKQN